ncbi:MAG: hypothetical protein IK082_03830 [Oscillospiraceae bacterium]|nr:hypothetical protein [Oscillospiraceae bacterium]
MVFLSHHRMDKHKKQTCILFTVIALVLIGAVLCLHFNGIRDKYRIVWEYPTSSPYDYPDTVWISESPMIVLHVSPKENAEMGSAGGSEAYMIVDGQRIPVDILMRAGHTPQVYALVYDLKKDRMVLHNVLLEGHFKRLTNWKIVIQIQTDNVFGGQYKTITLKRMWETGDEAMAIIEERFP